MVMNKEALGIILAIAAALVSGIAIPVNKVFVVGLEPAVFTAVRALIIGVIFLALSLAQSRVSRKKFRQVPWKYLLSIAVIGGAMAFLMFFTGLKFTTAGRGAFLHKTLPLFATALAFIFLKERVGRKQGLALLLMFIGAAAIYFAAIGPAAMWIDPSLGDLLVLGAAFMWAVESVIARKAMIKGETSFIVSFSRMFFGGVILFGAILLTGNLGALLALTPAQVINLLVSTALLFMYVLFWYSAIRHTSVSRASGFLLLAPVVSLVLGVMFLAEPAPLLQLAGSALILVGAGLSLKARSVFSTGV